MHFCCACITCISAEERENFSEVMQQDGASTTDHGTWLTGHRRGVGEASDDEGKDSESCKDSEDDLQDGDLQAPVLWSRDLSIRGEPPVSRLAFASSL